jgi:hypothetical protein
MAHIRISFGRDNDMQIFLHGEKRSRGAVPTSTFEAVSTNGSMSAALSAAAKKPMKVCDYVALE